MHIRVLIIASILLVVGCGPGGGTGNSNLPPTRFECSVVDKSGLPLGDVQAFVYETNESSITDAHGDFTLDSYTHLNSAQVYFKQVDYSNTVDLGTIPDDTVTVVAGFMIDTNTNKAELIGVEFQTATSTAPDTTTTPPPQTTAAPAKPPKPGAAPTPPPLKTPAPKPGNFDLNGNTAVFGIPAGMQGNINAGSAVWSGQCASCHGSEKTNRTFGQIKGSLRVIPSMQGLPTSTQQMADLTAFLNRARK